MISAVAARKALQVSEGVSSLVPTGSIEREAVQNSPPADESSEDDNNDEPDEGIPLEALLPQLSSTFPSNDRVTILSTFKPAAGRNMFFISGEDCSSLGVSNPATLVCLTAEDALCLLGSCRLMVLRGSLELCGTTLAATKTTHNIYAPRCSALPILKSGRGQSSGSVLDDQTTPHRLRGIFEFNTVLMFQSLETGVERLHLVCRPFSGMFEPSGSQGTTSSDWEVPGLHMV